MGNSVTHKCDSPLKEVVDEVLEYNIQVFEEQFSPLRVLTVRIDGLGTFSNARLGKNMTSYLERCCGQRSYWQ